MDIRISDSLCLTPMTRDDESVAVRLLNNRKIYDQMLRVPFPYSPADFHTFLEICDQAEQTQGYPNHFAIRDETLGFVGGCGFEGMIIGHRVEIGYWLGEPFWGQGIMPQVVARLCEFAFQEWNLVRITALTNTHNRASGRVLEKCGFQYEGTLAKRFHKGDKFLDAKLFAKTR